jgi:signal transduction histidine kinase
VAPAFVDVDRQRIVQVLTNLIGNALTYTNPGGHVTVTTTPGPPRATVVVTDTGIGVAAEDLDRVFERFYRVPDLARPPGGSGIGLTIARDLARAHHGDIRASSPGRGTGSTFTLTLPTV